MSSFPDPLAALGPLADWWRWSLRLGEAWSVSWRGRQAIELARRQRLSGLLAHARTHSPWYRECFAALPAGEPQLEQLPVQTKAGLMARFDDWVTDPAIRLAEVERFIADPARVGELFLGRYLLWTSSGSTGRPGIFVQDRDALAVYDALLSARFPAGSTAPSPFAILGRGGRMAMIAALDGHFAGAVSWERLRRSHPLMASATRSFSVLSPLPELVAALQQWRPTAIASYPTMLMLLAHERRAGRLQLDPQVLWSGGETLAQAERAEIEAAFGCPVIDGYGASECMQIAYDCGCGALHLNSDWVILEPVDEHGGPVPAGQESATVLLTNLANRVQPLIRYDLGDSVTMLPPCRCGSPFPALRVSGRRDDILELACDGGGVSLAPLAVATVVEEGSGVHRFQVIQTGPRALAVRFETPPDGDRAGAWARIVSSLRTYLARQGVHRVTIAQDPAPPRADPVSGKLREVLGLHAGAALAGKTAPRRRARRENEKD